MLRILKFGGTSVGNISLLENVAAIVKQELNTGNKIVVVVSAMAGITDQLVGYAHALSHDVISDEHDLVYAAGEQVTAGLMTLALQKVQIKSKSFLAWQIPILTDNTPTCAKIIDIQTDKITHCLQQGIVPIVAGFQGVSTENRITTLGRGGSDLTAVALAVAMKADYCDIYTDVDGVFTADPNLVPLACKKAFLTYEEMFALATNGAKVLQARSVELAMKHKVKVRILSSFNPELTGTEIGMQPHNDHDSSLEHTVISGIAHSNNIAKITVIEHTEKAIQLLTENQISTDMLQYHHNSEGKLEISFVCSNTDVEKIRNLLNKVAVDKNVAKIAVVGIGIQNNLNAQKKIFNVLKDNGISMQMLSISELKVSLLITQDLLQKAVVALHKTFNLDDIKKAA